MPSTMWFKGGAASVAEVDTFTPAGTITTGDVNKLTYTDQTGTVTVVSFTTGGTTTATAVSAGLIAAWNGNTAAALAATASGTSTVVLTATTAGTPFSVVSSVTGVGTLTRAPTTPNAGPQAWDTAANWSGGAVPATGDTAILDGRMLNAIIYGLSQSGVTLAELDDYRSSLFQVGTQFLPLAIGATVARILQSPTNGANTIGAFRNIDFGTVAVELFIGGSASQGIGGLAPCTVAANNSANIVNVSAGTVWLNNTGTTGAYASVNVSAGAVTIGATAQPVLVNNSGGTVNVLQTGSGMTVVTTNGSTYLNGTAIVAAVTANGGNTFINNRVSGTDVTLLTMNNGGVDFSQRSTAIVVGGLTVHGGGTITQFNSSQVTYTTTTWDTSDGVDLKVVNRN